MILLPQFTRDEATSYYLRPDLTTQPGGRFVFFETGIYGKRKVD